MNKLMTSLIAAATVGLFGATAFAADTAPTKDKVVVTTHKAVHHAKHHVTHKAHHVAHAAHATGDAITK